MNDMIAMDTSVPFHLYRVDGNKILNLRHRVLREGLPLESASFEGDELPDTWHVALCTEVQGDVVCCASFMRRSIRKVDAWQLRGMATDTAHQKKGWGKILITNSLPAISDNSRLYRFWCNARVPAISFYEKLGWHVTSEEFVIPDAGPHREMVTILK
jgi:predicted GNAT family N-acyltransferase